MHRLRTASLGLWDGRVIGAHEHRSMIEDRCGIRAFTAEAAPENVATLRRNPSAAHLRRLAF